MAAASAFAPAALPFGASTRAATTSIKMQYSPSIPFLKKPSALDESMPGYTGFDPLGLSSIANVKFLQESEIKHGRIAMLAVLGTVVQDLVQDPSYLKITGGAKLTAAHDKLVAGGTMGQILFWVSFAEVIGTIALFETLEGKREPGDFKFDPLGFAKTDSKTWALKEIKNGRLAMLGFAGIIHHYFITGKGPIELLTNFKIGA